MKYTTLAIGFIFALAAVALAIGFFWHVAFVVGIIVGLYLARFMRWLALWSIKREVKFDKPEQGC